MKCLTVRQPHATWIATGLKTIEVRSWFTHYRGPLLIHAAGRVARGHRGEPHGPLGVTICIVTLDECRDMGTRDGRPVYHWMLRGRRRVRHVPMKGQMAIYDPPSHVLKSLGLFYDSLCY